MKQTLTALLIFVSFAAFAQDDLKIPLIEIEGISVRKVSSDEAIFSINLEEKSMKVVSAVETLNRKTKNLADALKKAKIKDYKLIADNYSVDINRVYRSGFSIDSGYVARQSLRIVTTSKSDDLQKIVEAIQESGDMSFNLHFQVSETTRNSLEDTMLIEALKNAESRALLIAQTLGIKTIRVHRVSLESPQQIYPKSEMMRSRADASSEVLIAADDQTLVRKVYMKYTY
ncbi:MAG: hypothetical protein ACI9UV_002386 [Algoriphagus sp.]|jgi:uncharacterized protein YggE